MPTKNEWRTFAKWGEEYGPIISTSVFGQRIIIINSSELAIDMLNKKSAIYSDRPVLQMGGELVGWKDTLILLRYGERFRNSRRLSRKLFGSHSTMKPFLPVVEQETRKSLGRLMRKPEGFAEHARKTAGAIILRIAYGYEAAEEGDPFVRLADEAVEQFSLSTTPGFLVNFFPPLRHFPEWLPGGGFHKTAREWRQKLEELINRPFDLVKSQIAAGTAEPSFTAKLLQDDDVTPEIEFDIKWLAGSLYGGGADTTVSTVTAFFKAMTLYPEVQALAQEELDRVIGPDRLPEYSDRPNLPYINALVLELLRWHTVIPNGFPHVVMEDNIHDGYFIPKGSLVLSNIWYMLHDPKRYHDPFKFDPARFLGKNPEPDPTDVCFGFGRRVCPGKLLADASAFVSCAMTLAVFIISPTEDGAPINSEQSGTGIISHPSPFTCSILPRSEKAKKLAQSARLG